MLSSALSMSSASTALFSLLPLFSFGNNAASLAVFEPDILVISGVFIGVLPARFLSESSFFAAWAANGLFLGNGGMDRTFLCGFFNSLGKDGISNLETDSLN